MLKGTAAAFLLLLVLHEAVSQGSSSGGRSSSSSSRSSVSSRSSSSSYSYYSYSSSYYSYSSSYYTYSTYYGYYSYGSRGPPSPAGVIVGAVIGSIVGCIVLVVLCLFGVSICKGRMRTGDECCSCLPLCCAGILSCICCIFCCCRNKRRTEAKRETTTVRRAESTVAERSREEVVLTTGSGSSRDSNASTAAGGKKQATTAAAASGSADPDAPSFGGGKWGLDPSDNPARLKYVQGDPNEVTAGYSAVFPSGRWSGYYVEWAKQHNMQMELRFFDGQVSGQGQDPIGNFLFFGIYRDSTKRVSWVKQYVGKHCVEYRGTSVSGGIDGDWAMLDNPKGSFTANDAFHLQCDERIPADQRPGPPPSARPNKAPETAIVPEPGPPAGPPPSVREGPSLEPGPPTGPPPGPPPPQGPPPPVAPPAYRSSSCSDAQ